MNAYKFNNITDWCMISLGFMLGAVLMLYVTISHEQFIQPILIIGGIIAVCLSLAIFKKVEAFEKKLKEIDI